MGTGGWSISACLGLCLLVVLSSPDPAKAADRRVLSSGAHSLIEQLTVSKLMLCAVG